MQFCFEGEIIDELGRFSLAMPLLPNIGWQSRLLPAGDRSYIINGNDRMERQDANFFYAVLRRTLRGPLYIYYRFFSNVYRHLVSRGGARFCCL